MNWKKLFKSHILQRGYGYYKEKCIQDIIKDKEVYTAIVEGTEDYEVSIHIKNDTIFEMSCDCPYAGNGDNCKHMAAFLYQIFEKSLEENRIQIKDEVDSVGSIVNEASEELKKEFLVNLLSNDKNLFIKFKNSVCKKITYKDIESYKVTIDCIFEDNSDNHNFINYYNGMEFEMELDEFLTEVVRDLLKIKAYKETLELTGHILLKFEKYDIDGSNGEVTLIFEDLKEIWEEIIEKCENVEFERYLYHWFTYKLDNFNCDYGADYFEEIIFNYFCSEEFLLKKKLYIEEKLKLFSRKENFSYYIDEWSKQYLRVLKKLGVKKEELEKCRKKYWKYSSIRRDYIDEYIEKKEYEKAIRILKESTEIDREFCGLVENYSIILKELYFKTGRNEDYKEELWNLLLKYDKGNIEYFKELKVLYSKPEWEKERIKIFESLKKSHLVNCLYLEEGLLNELCDNILKNHGLDELKIYERVLKPLYSTKLLKKYEEEVQKMVIVASDRKMYSNVVSILKRMKKYPEGTLVVSDIVTEWKVTYKRRKAMMQELEKI